MAFPTDPLQTSHNDFTDWLRLSPCESQSSPLQDISSSSQISNFESNSISSSCLYASNFGATPANETQNTPSDHSVALCFPKFLPPSSSSQLYCSPSPTFSNQSTTQTGCVDSHSPLLPLDPGSLKTTYFSESQGSYDLGNSPLAALFPFRELPQNFDDDVSPVIRGSQEHIRFPLELKEQPVRKPEKPRSRFLDRLVSMAHTPAVDPLVPSTVSSTLLSPCKIATPPAYRMLRQSRRGHEQFSRTGDTPSAAETGFGLHSVSKSPVPVVFPLPPRTLSGAASPPTPVMLKIPKRRRDEKSDLSPEKRLRCGFDEETDPHTLPTILEPKNRQEQAISTSRTFPGSVEISSSFPLFYRRFPASSYFQPANKRYTKLDSAVLLSG